MRSPQNCSRNCGLKLALLSFLLQSNNAKLDVHCNLAHLCKPQTLIASKQKKNAKRRTKDRHKTQNKAEILKCKSYLQKRKLSSFKAGTEKKERKLDQEYKRYEDEKVGHAMLQHAI